MQRLKTLHFAQYCDFILHRSVNCTYMWIYNVRSDMMLCLPQFYPPQTNPHENANYANAMRVRSLNKCGINRQYKWWSHTPYICFLWISDDNTEHRERFRDIWSTSHIINLSSSYEMLSSWLILEDQKVHICITTISNILNFNVSILKPV